MLVNNNNNNKDLINTTCFDWVRFICFTNGIHLSALYKYGQDKFEHTKEVTTSCQWRKDWQYKGLKKKNKNTNNGRHNTTQKTLRKTQQHDPRPTNTNKRVRTQVPRKLELLNKYDNNIQTNVEWACNNTLTTLKSGLLPYLTVYMTNLSGVLL